LKDRNDNVKMRKKAEVMKKTQIKGGDNVCTDIMQTGAIQKKIHQETHKKG